MNWVVRLVRAGRVRQPVGVLPATDETVPAPALRRRRLALLAGGAFVLVTSVMWVYALFFASRTSLDRVPDRAWTTSAQAICTDVRTRIDALPAAASFRKVEPLTEALRQRAVVLAQADALLAEELASLRSLRAADATTAKLTTEWLTDWDTYLGDRRDHAVELGTGKDSAFKESTYKESPISNRMDAFARVNLMDRCQVPFDLA